MVGFIELHFVNEARKATAELVPFLQAVASIVRVQPFGEHAIIECLAGDDTETHKVQESYADVVALLQSFFRQAAAAARPPQPFVRTHKR